MDPEKKANAALRAGIVQLGDRWERVENMLVPGMPDINACFNGCEFWIESKAPKEPKRETTKLFGGNNHDLLLEQRNWMLGQLKAGGKVFIYIETTNWRIMLHGRCADVVNHMTLAECIKESLWTSARPTPKDEWAKLRATIIKECQ